MTPHRHCFALTPFSLSNFSVPTTAGTGSETTGAAIVDIPSLRFKTGIASRALRPTLGIVDSRNTKSCPRSVNMSAGLDVVSRSSLFSRARGGEFKTHTTRRHLSFDAALPCSGVLHCDPLRPKIAETSEPDRSTGLSGELFCEYRETKVERKLSGASF